MTNTTNFSVRMDSELKKQCEALYGELGMTLTTAINVFLRQSLRTGGFPFPVVLTPTLTSAILEAEQLANDPTVKRYDDVEGMLQKLKSGT